MAARALEHVAENPRRFADVALVCQDGVTVDSSVLVLAAVSPVLEVLLLGEFKEGGAARVELPAVAAPGLEALLAALREPEGRPEEAQGARRVVEALAAARFLQVPDALTAVAHSWAQEDLAAGHHAELLAGAEEWTLDKLTEQCVAYAAEHFEEVSAERLGKTTAVAVGGG